MNLTGVETVDEQIQSIFQDVIDGRRNEVARKVQVALDAGLPAEDILSRGLIAAMGEVGARFEREECYVPEMMLSARAMQSGLAVLKPHIAAAGIQATGRVVIGTVKGDLHDIGKSLVAMMLEGAGFEIIDLGTDVAPERFVAAAQQNQAQLVALSTLLTTTMQNMRETLEALTRAGLRDRIKVIVGGAPVTQSFANDIGADGYAPDASRAVGLAKSFVA